MHSLALRAWIHAVRCEAEGRNRRHIIHRSHPPDVLACEVAQVERLGRYQLAALPAAEVACCGKVSGPCHSGHRGLDTARQSAMGDLRSRKRRGLETLAEQ